MRTFEEEHKELITWYFSERDRIEEKKKPWSGGLDGEYDGTMGTLQREYRTKLNKLRKKYKR